MNKIHSEKKNRRNVVLTKSKMLFYRLKYYNEWKKNWENVQHSTTRAISINGFVVNLAHDNFNFFFASKSKTK